MIKYLPSLCTFLLLPVLFYSCQFVDLNVSELKTEGFKDPLGIDRPEPLLSWTIDSDKPGEGQTAYHILVASNTENLRNDVGDLWDSEKVKSIRSTGIRYNGTVLRSEMEAFWKVRVYNAEGKASPWSPQARWSMGLMGNADWQAKWIGLDRATGTDRPDQEYRVLSARYLRKEVQIDKVIEKATAYIVGMGTYEFYLNGERVGNHVLSPGLTDYAKRAFYVPYDVTGILSQGINTVGVILGNGRYFAPRFKEPTLMITYGYPKMILQIDIAYKDGTMDQILSDETWKITADGPIRENNEYDGEFYDARMELGGWNQNGYDDSDWIQAENVESSSPVLSAQMIHPIRVTETINPISVSSPKPGMYVFDMGQNMVGWTRLRVKADEGTVIRQRFAEILNEDGSLYLDNIRGAKVTDTYIAKGEGIETYAPRFIFHGFRYVELTGFSGTPDLSTLVGEVVHDDLSVVGSFECSNELINQIYRNAVWGLRGNYRSIPTDCPQRDERQGWLGDRATGSRGESYVYDVQNFYRKWLTDVFDSQRESGSIPDVNPAYWPMYNDNVTWAGTPIMLVRMIYDQYGDMDVIISSYDHLKKWIDYMTENYMVNDLMPRDTYGDWCVPPIDPTVIHTKNPERLTAKEYIGSAFFYHDLGLMEYYAKLLDKQDDASNYGKLAGRMKVAFNKEYFNSEAGTYSNNSATSSILALAFDLVPDDKRDTVFENLVHKIEVEHDAHITTGLIGQEFVNRVLTRYHRADLAWKMNTQTDYPGYGYMIKNGATTIWELWNGNTADPAMNSGNHVMLLGDFLIWLYEDLAGIRPDYDNPGFKKIIMRPQLIDGLDFVKSSHKSPYGKITSEWRISGGIFRWDIRVPSNSSALIYLPVGSMPEIEQNGEVLVIREENLDGSYYSIEIPSGTYHFQSSLN